MNDRSHPLSKEPLFNAPFLVFALPVLLIALYALQSALEAAAGPEGQQLMGDAFGLRPPLLVSGHYSGLLTHLFVHGSWLHVLMNSVFCLAFAAPVVRACGATFLGGLSFFAFYILCGAVAGLGYCLLNLHSSIPVVGASGAISGLMAAGIRLGGDTYDPPGIRSLIHPQVVGMSVFWCGVNTLIPVASQFITAPGLVVAWQAHIVGYLFGLLAISPWLHLFHRRYFTTK